MGMSTSPQSPAPRTSACSADSQTAVPYLSIIVPLHNEEKNIGPLYEKIMAVLDQLGHTYEIVLVNDGSCDSTPRLINEMAKNNPRLKVLHLRRGFGQTAAMSAGIDHAAGEVLIPMDGDLQNDPEDIPHLLEKLDEGYDVVSGWRKDREDHFLRTVLSRIANSMISFLSDVPLHDYGCTLKAYRREVIKGVRLYGEMHRFIPIYAYWQGARVTELPVRHHPRIHGVSNYGFERTIKVVLDIIVIKFMGAYYHKPIYVFGALGLFCLLLSFLGGVFAVGLKWFKNISLIQTPLPLLSVLLTVLGVMAILMGLIAEMLVRTYYESQNKPTYLIRDKVNFPE